MWDYLTERLIAVLLTFFPEICWAERSRVAPDQNLHTCKESAASVSLKEKSSLLFWQMFQLPSDTDGPWHWKHLQPEKKTTTFLISLHCGAANSNIHGDPWTQAIKWNITIDETQWQLTMNECLASILHRYTTHKCRVTFIENLKNSCHSDLKSWKQESSQMIWGKKNETKSNSRS